MCRWQRAINYSFCRARFTTRPVGNSLGISDAELAAKRNLYVREIQPFEARIIDRAYLAKNGKDSNTYISEIRSNFNALGTTNFLTTSV